MKENSTKDYKFQEVKKRQRRKNKNKVQPPPMKHEWIMKVAQPMEEASLEVQNEKENEIIHDQEVTTIRSTKRREIKTSTSNIVNRFSVLM